MIKKRCEVFDLNIKKFPFNRLCVSFCSNPFSFDILKDYILIHSTIENLEVPVEELKRLKKGIDLIFDRLIEELGGIY